MAKKKNDGVKDESKLDSEMDDILNDLIKVSGNENASVIGTDGCIADVNNYMDTGCYLLNAQISSSLFGGLPEGQVLALSGEASTGKTFFSVSIINKFLQENKNGMVLIFDSENAVNSNRLTARVPQTKTITHYPVVSLLDFKKQCLNILEKINTYPIGKYKFMIILDSLGMLPSQKEIDDGLAGESKADFTRTKEIRSIFRTITVRLAKHKIPFIVTNHSYASIGSYGAAQAMAGGGGLKYAASYILMLTKAKDKNANGEQIGVIITSTSAKNRDAKEGTKVKIALSYKKGLHLYFGLLEKAIEYNLWSYELNDAGKPKKGGKIVIDGKLYTEKEIYSKPENFFTKEFLEKMDPYIRKEFGYGNNFEDVNEDEELNLIDSGESVEEE